MTVRGRVTVAGALLLAALQLAWLFGGVPGAARPNPGDPAQQRAANRSAPGIVPGLSSALLAPPVSRDALSRIATGTQEGSLRVHYTLDPALTRRVWKILDRGRVALGHVLVMDAHSGALLAYVATDPQAFSPARTYPAASLVKVVTAAAVLAADPTLAKQHCRYAGSPYRLTRRRLDPPRRGYSISIARALATSNNQCFAQWAVHRLGGYRLLAALDRFGLLRSVALGHASGLAEDPGEDKLAIGRLGSGLAGLRITPLHAVQLAATLVDGHRVTPHWIAGVEDAGGHPVAWRKEGRPSAAPEVLTPQLAGRMRHMLIQTTTRGTARKAFRTRRGRPLLPGIAIAAKTGSLSGRDPDGRYEWFIGLAPADHPRVAVATLEVQGPLYWMSASQPAAEVLKEIFCPNGVCRASAAGRYLAKARKEEPPAEGVDGGYVSAGG